MKKEINFTKSEANALRNITKILICYFNDNINNVESKELYVGLKVLVSLHQSLDEGETKFGFSDNIREFIIDMIDFWYKGVGYSVYNSKELKGTAGVTFRKHYKLVPSILNKLKNGI